MEAKMFDELLESVKEARDIAKGKTLPSRKFTLKTPNPKDIRTKLKMTQSELASFMNISIHTLRNWEQGRREPEGPAKVLLNLADLHPEIFRQFEQSVIQKKTL